MKNLIMTLSSTKQSIPKTKSSTKRSLTQKSPTSPLTFSSTPRNLHSASPQQILQLQRLVGNRAVQRALQAGPGDPARIRPMGAAGGTVSGEVQGALDQARGGGRPLDKTVGTQVGGALGADLSGVRVHTDSRSQAINQSLGAEAATVGNDIFFSKGAYHPGTSSGKKLLAHELTHVVQQGGHKGNKVQTQLTVGPANDSYEQEAERTATQLIDGSNFGAVSRVQRKPTFTIQRKMDFKPEDLHGELSLMAMGNKAIGKESKFSKMKNLLTDYWATHEAAEEATLLEGLIGVSGDWITKSKKDSTKSSSVLQLNLRAKHELPKAQKKAAYMADLLQGSKKFNYLSEKSRLIVPNESQQLAQGKTDERQMGRKAAAFDLVQKFHLTDAEVAAIKVYTVDDYKYINTALIGKDDWLKNSLPTIKGLDSERGGQAMVLAPYTYRVSRREVKAARAMVERGQGRIGDGVIVTRSGAKDPVARSTIESISSNKGNQDSDADLSKGFGAGQEVIIKIAKFDDFQNGDLLRFADVSGTGLAQAKAEGLRHGQMAKKGLKKLPEYKDVAYRGMTITPEDLATKYKKGGVVDYLNFTSTSKARSESEVFIGNELAKDKALGGDKVGLLLHLNVQEKGRDVSNLSLVEKEQEVLLMPGTRFKMDTAPVKNEAGGYYEVSATQVTAEQQRMEEEQANKPQRPPGAPGGRPTKVLPP